MPNEEVVIAGASAAGLSVAAMLQRAGIPSLLLERSDCIGASWRGRYESLYLNTPRLTSTLAGYRMPRRYGRWPTRDDVIEYLEEYARRCDARIRFETALERVDRDDGDWRLRTSDGELTARHVVIATGPEARPSIPDWPGRAGFEGELIHSLEYRNADPFQGRDVLVVGPNTSGSEIAQELAIKGAARVRTAMRKPPFISTREWPRGVPVNTTAVMLDLLPDRAADAVGQIGQRIMYGNLSKYGLPYSPIGPQTNTVRRHQGALIDDGFVKSLKEGRIEIVAAVEAFDGADVILADGTRIQPDAVIASTGWLQGLEPIVGHLDVLAEDGFPRVSRKRQTEAGVPRLYFNGYWGTISGGLRHMRRGARKIARAIARS
jgi:putative flavoprotein involved in K+ transport